MRSMNSVPGVMALESQKENLIFCLCLSAISSFTFFSIDVRYLRRRCCLIFARGATPSIAINMVPVGDESPITFSRAAIVSRITAA